VCAYLNYCVSWYISESVAPHTRIHVHTHTIPISQTHTFPVFLRHTHTHTHTHTHGRTCFRSAAFSEKNARAARASPACVRARKGSMAHPRNPVCVCLCVRVSVIVVYSKCTHHTCTTHCTHTHTHTHTYTHTHSYTLIHIHTHTHTHTSYPRFLGSPRSRTQVPFSGTGGWRHVFWHGCLGCWC
jgi:hypothetical protein